METVENKKNNTNLQQKTEENQIENTLQVLAEVFYQVYQKRKMRKAKVIEMSIHKEEIKKTA